MNNHKMKKKFGQNFLTDKNLLIKIVESAQIENKNVIEIGPGQGGLTNFLVLKANKVLAYEIDLELKPFLDEIEKKHNNLKVIYGDILKIDLKNDEEYHVVANIPYNITSPIIFKILATKNIQSATLMVQKEVCERIVSQPNKKTYNAFSVIVQYYMKVEKIINVSKKLFKPVPKVDSAVFRMERKKTYFSKLEEELFLKIVKRAFQQKRKTVLNNLIELCEDGSKERLTRFLNELGINENLRAENLFLEDFIKITEKWPSM